MKVQPVATMVEDIDSLKKNVENLSMVLKVSQAMLQQILPHIQILGEEGAANKAEINELQYRLLALQKVCNVDEIQIKANVDLARFNDFEQSSAEDDIKNNLYKTDEVTSPDSIVIITSNTDDGKGIYRSKIVLKETGNQELIDGLIGKKVGDSLEIMLNDTKHNVILLGVREKAAQAPIE